jgi:phosphatidylinositol alpha-mannosyltransferase
MAAGAAVVASDIDGYRNVARAGIDAQLVPPQDADALRQALRGLLDDGSRRAELVAAGEQRAAEFSLRRLAEKFASHYERAIAAHRAPAA